MKLSELIEKLETLKDKHGDVYVEDPDGTLVSDVRYEGDFNIVVIES